MKAVHKRQQPARTEQLEFLLAACHRVTLEPHDREARRIAARLLTMAEVSAEKNDSSLVAALIKEIRAHADELAFRLDTGGTTSLHVGAIAARLCQAVTALQRQMTGGSRADGRPPSSPQSSAAAAD
jgi:hypothetical protein